MKFGQKSSEGGDASASGSTGFMKYMKDGDNFLHIADEYENWVWYWEHYNPGGFPFPCTTDRSTCPGCTSDNEKMKKAQRRVSFNAFDGEYTNVWKIPKTVAEKLKNRSDRLGTITDRPYIVTRMKNSEGFYDYDIEGQEKQALDVKKEHLRDPEELLAQAYDDAWGDSTKAKETSAKVARASEEQDLQEKINAEVAQREKAQPEDAPFEQTSEPKVVSEADLRKMTPFELINLCKEEGLGEPEGDTPDAIVDWMLEKV